MAGHSKWNNIKNKKGKEDAKRGKIFTKLARYITVAAREGGPDPDYNASLKAAIEKAKAENMPNDNIDRAIKKASGAGDQDNFEEITYEGYGPSGIAVMVKCLTDNRNRTAPDVRHAFDKNGGNMGNSGCVSFMFDRKGQLGIVLEEGMDPDQVLLDAIDSGAEDVQILEDGIEITTEPEDFHQVYSSLGDKGYKFVISEINYIPQTTTSLSDENDIKNMRKLIDQLEDNDDVQEVYHNWDEPEE